MKKLAVVRRPEVQWPITIVHTPRVRSPLPLLVVGRLQLGDRGRQLLQRRVVDDQYAVEVVELVLTSERQATSDKRQATSDKRQATSDK